MRARVHRRSAVRKRASRSIARAANGARAWFVTPARKGRGINKNVPERQQSSTRSFEKWRELILLSETKSSFAL